MVKEGGEGKGDEVESWEEEGETGKRGEVKRWGEEGGKGPKDRLVLPQLYVSGQLPLPRSNRHKFLIRLRESRKEEKISLSFDFL